MHRWLDLLRSNDYLGVKNYLKEGGDPNQKSETGESVLAYALRYRCDEAILELLIQSGADLKDCDNEGVSIFDMAITYDNLKLVRRLVESGLYDVNQTSRKSGLTPLMCATCYGRVEVVKYLLQKGANKEATEHKGLRAEDFAKKMNKRTVLKILRDQA